MEFEWDEAKAAVNRRKHGVSFEEASDVFMDPSAVETYDFEHPSLTEDRYRLVGISGKGRRLVVIYTERGDVCRIISARRAAPGEAKDHGEA